MTPDEQIGARVTATTGEETSMSLLERDERVIGRVGKLRFSPLVATRGEGSFLFDEAGGPAG